MPTYPTSICTLDDVKDFLGIPLSQTSKDAILQRYIDAATEWATYASDAIIPTTYTNEVHDGGAPQIVLFNTPILEVTSIIEYVGANAYELTDTEAGGNQTYGFSIDNASAGIISRRWNGMVGSFMSGEKNVVVTYVAGFAQIPADIQTYVLMDIQGLFDASQQGSRPSVNGGSDYAYSASLPLNAFPRLASLMSSSRRVPAVG
jgi:hypothetical protein